MDWDQDLMYTIFLPLVARSLKQLSYSWCPAPCKKCSLDLQLPLTVEDEEACLDLKPRGATSVDRTLPTRKTQVSRSNIAITINMGRVLLAASLPHIVN